MSRSFPVAGAGIRALVGWLALTAVGCSEQAAQEPAEPAPAVADVPPWKPAPPIPPTPCGVGCVEGQGNAVVRFQMEGGDYTASASVEGNRGPFIVSSPVGISQTAEDWSGITTFFVREPGVRTLRIRATGEWTLTILKGKQSYVDG